MQAPSPSRAPVASHASTRRRLRSRAVRASLLGAAAFALTACEEPVDLTFFVDAEQCRSAAAESSEFSEGDCDRAFEQAAAEHAVLAPRYDDFALCEEQHGEGACATSQAAGGIADGLPPEGAEAAQASGGGASFMPFFMGYMMGNMLSSNRPGGYAGRPVYQDAKGQFFSTDGRSFGFAGPGSKVSGYASQMQSPNLTRVAPPMTRAVVQARGGFGAARASAFGG